MDSGGAPRAPRGVGSRTFPVQLRAFQRPVMPPSSQRVAQSCDAPRFVCFIRLPLSLQSMEDFMVKLFEDCNLCAIHAKRVTISAHISTRSPALVAHLCARCPDTRALR